MLKSAFSVATSNILASVFSLARNLIFARILTVEHFGIVATFSIFVTLIEVGQNAGINRMIVQAKDGHRSSLIGAMHGAQVIIGLLNAALLMCIAWPYAHIIGTSSLIWAYLLLAASPLLKGFTHLDPFRQQRHKQFNASNCLLVLPLLASLAALWPAYMWLGDFRAMLVCLCVQHLSYVVLSHRLSSRPYRLAFKAPYLRRAASFSWPIIINGALLFLILNGDRLIVGNRFGLEVLGWFSAAFMITLMPSMLLGQILQTLMLPSYARLRDDDMGFQRTYDQAIKLVLLGGLTLTFGFLLLGKWAFTLLFGADYSAALPYLVMLASMQAIRVARTVPATAALARAETKNPLFASLGRVMFIPLGFYAAVATENLFYVLLIGIVAELISLSIACFFANKNIGLRHIYIFKYILFSLICLVVFNLSNLAFFSIYISVALFVFFIIWVWKDALSLLKGMG